MTAPTVGLPRRRARMASYAIWQSRDFLMNIAIVSLLLFGLLGALSILQVQAMEQMSLMMKKPAPLELSQKARAFVQAFSVFVTVGPIICLSGIVSQDRAMGYTRFLFAKPLSVRWYYFQSLLVRFIGFVALGIALVLAYNYFEPPTLSPTMLADMLVSFLSIGGIVFLVSVVSRFDGLIAIVFLLVSSVIWGAWRVKDGIRYAVTYLVPPLEKSGDMHNWAAGLDGMGRLTAVEFPWKWALWSAGYGLACFALGLYLLRRIPLTKA
jgi:hypothetical protein